MDKGYKYYAAYGFFMSLAQMSDKCPTAMIAGTGELKGYRLCFRGLHAEAVAVLEPDKDATVPVLVWEITPVDEAALDRCEGFPSLCTKEQVKVKLDGKTVTATAHLIKTEDRPLSTPSAFHYNAILEGYRDAGLDTDILRQALETSVETEKNAVDRPL